MKMFFKIFERIFALVLIGVIGHIQANNYVVLEHENIENVIPPQIFPPSRYQIVKANETYRLRCESLSKFPVYWSLPETKSSTDLHLRTRLTYATNDEEHNLAMLEISHLVYSDTGSYYCYYNASRNHAYISMELTRGSYVHLYVEDPNHLMTRSGFEFLQAVQTKSFVLPCQPTHPSIKITLTKSGRVIQNGEMGIQYDSKVGFRISPVTLEYHSGIYVCTAQYHGRKEVYRADLAVLVQTMQVPPPQINHTMARHVRVGLNFQLSCSVVVEAETIVELEWTSPNARNQKAEKRLIMTSVLAGKNHSIGSRMKIVQKDILVKKATFEDQGKYICSVVDHSGNAKSTMAKVSILKETDAYLRIYSESFNSIKRTIRIDSDKEASVQWVVQIEAYPRPKVTWYGPNRRKILTRRNLSHASGYTIRTVYGANSRTMLKINKLELKYSGTYTVRVDNKAGVRTENFTLVIMAPPKVEATVVEHQGLYQFGKTYTFKCSAHGYPVPKIIWLFKPCSTFKDCHADKVRSLPPSTYAYEDKFQRFGRDSVIKRVAHNSGKYVCQACNKIDCMSVRVPFFITDATNGFEIEAPKIVLEGEPLKLKCSASIYNFTGGRIEWFRHTLNGKNQRLAGDGIETSYSVTSYSTDFSFSKVLSFSSVYPNDSARYICRVTQDLQIQAAQVDINLNRYNNYPSLFGDDDDDDDDSIHEIHVNVNILPLKAPNISKTNLVGSRTLISNGVDAVILKCYVTGRPVPSIRWMYNNGPLNASRDIVLSEKNQILTINHFSHSDEGIYSCRARNKVGTNEVKQAIQLRSSAEKEKYYSNIFIPVLVALVIAVLLVIILVIGIKMYFNNGSDKKSWKTSSTPRLTQYELPQNSPIDGSTCSRIIENDDCRLTVTSRDGSSSPYGTGQSITSGKTCDVINHCHGCQVAAHIIHTAGEMTLAPRCSICDFSVQTLPLKGLTLKKGFTQFRHSNLSISPRLSANF